MKIPITTQNANPDLLVLFSDLASYEKDDKSTDANENAGQTKRKKGNHAITQA